MQYQKVLTMEKFEDSHENFCFEIKGRVKVFRDHGEKGFIDFRYNRVQDIQIVLTGEYMKNNYSIGTLLRVVGVLKHRNFESEVNLLKSKFNLTKNISTWEEFLSLRNKYMNINDDNYTWEIHAKEIEVIHAPHVEDMRYNSYNKKEIDNISESLKHEYRSIYLRSNRMQNHLFTKAKLFSFSRKFMEENKFMEIITPILTSSTPEGANDFVIPSRLHPGKFYALPQSPQQFKQILMTSGIEKYYSIAPCFRDEDSRSDRNYGEFYQLDYEIAHHTLQEVISFAQNYILSVLKHMTPERLVNSYEISYERAMLEYGSDKPDLLINNAFQKAHKDIVSLKIFQKYEPTEVMMWSLDMNHEVFKNNNIRKKCIEKIFKIYKNKSDDDLFTFIYRDEFDAIQGDLKKYLNKGQLACEMKKNSFIFFSGGPKASLFLGDIRTKIMTYIRNLIPDLPYSLLIVSDFPMFEEKNGEITFMHNPFSKPYADLSKNLSRSEILNMKSYQYDVVLNGYEIASGSQRNRDIESLIGGFLICGHKREDVLKNFKGLINAFKTGVPDHAGAAFGLERILMIIMNAKNIRDVIAFPLNANGQDFMMGSPSDISESTKRILKI